MSKINEKKRNRILITKRALITEITGGSTAKYSCLLNMQLYMMLEICRKFPCLLCGPLSLDNPLIVFLIYT